MFIEFKEGDVFLCTRFGRQEKVVFKKMSDVSTNFSFEGGPEGPVPSAVVQFPNGTEDLVPLSSLSCLDA